MPSRHAAGLRSMAAVIVTTYLAPALLPGLSGLSHDVFHVVAQPAAVSSGDEGHVHAHPHSHVEGGPVHAHVELVDVLLAAPLAQDALEDAHAPAADASAPGVHLPAIASPALPLSTRVAGPASDAATSAASLVTPPQTPPPRV